MKLTPQLLRKADWFTTKLPIAMGFFYLGLWAAGAPPVGRVMAAAALMLLAFAGSGVFVRFYNDLFDLAADAKGGKFNLAGRVSPFWRGMIPVLATVFILLILAILKAPPYLYGLMGLQHLFYLLYSTPPIRLKNRSLGGVLADAAYGHAMPAVIGWAFAFAVLEGAERSIAFFPVVLAIAGLQFISGLNNILFHQIEDIERDKAAGARTFVVVRGKSRAQALGLRWLLPLEGAGLLVFLLFLSVLSRAPILPALIPLVLAHLLTAIRRENEDKSRPFKKNEPKTSQTADSQSNLKRGTWPVLVPRPGKNLKPSRKTSLLLLFNEVFDTWLPLAFLLMLIGENSGYWLLLAFHLLVFFEPSTRRLYYYLIRTKPLFGWAREKVLLFYYHWLLKQYARLLPYLERGKAVKPEDECAES